MSLVRRRWFGNSLVNLVGGLSAAGVNVLLPAVVVKHLSAEAFAVWNLALQMLVYVNLLSLGLQTATAREIAHAADAGPSHPVDLPTIVRAARSIGQVSSGAALIVVALLVVTYPLMFPGLNPQRVADFRMTLALFGLGAVAQILANADMGTFQGLHRNSVFVSVQLGVRLLTVALVWIGAVAGGSMVTLALMMAVSASLLWPSMRHAFRRLLPWAQEVSRAEIHRPLRFELLQYCATLSVWSVSMLLVNSTGIVVVGRVDFLMAGPYAIAMTAASVLVGLLSAALSPLLTTAAAMHASEIGRTQLPGLLLRSTLGVGLGLNFLAALVFAGYPVILSLWVGAGFVQTAGPLVVVLVGAHCLRNVAAPYALMLLAIGKQRRAMVSALLEGVTTLVASVWLGLNWGAIGVACGTLVGAVVGVVGCVCMNTPRTPELTPNPARFALLGLLPPFVMFLPLHYWLLHDLWVKAL